MEEANLASDLLTKDAISAQVQFYMSQYGPLCWENEDLQYLAHLNEPNLARDLDLIRNFMGIDTIDFYGWWHGSIVGITYAAMFPARVGRFMIDGTLSLYVANGRGP